MKNQPRKQWLEIRGARINEDADGFICLNDLHRLSRAGANKMPPQWSRLPTTVELVEAVTQNMGKSHVKTNSRVKSATYSKKGKGGGTYAHPILALSYAEYLSPELAIDVKETYLRFRQGDITLVDEILEKADEAKKWQGTRDASKLARERFSGVLHDHGCSGSDIGYVTNAIYLTLLGGKAVEVRRAMKLPTNGSIRDNLPLKELIQTMATEVMASERIEEEDKRGRSQCYAATARAASFIKEAFDREKADRNTKC